MSVLLTGRNRIKRTNTVTETKTVTCYPAAYDAVNNSYYTITGAANPVGKGSSNTTYAMIYLTTGTYASTYVYYPFDVSDIPADAVIESVSCKAKASISTATTSYVPTRAMQLYSGDTEKGVALDLTTTATAQILDCGTWTREELENCKLALYASRGMLNATATNYNIKFYGAELTVTYTYTYEEEVFV